MPTTAEMQDTEQRTTGTESTTQSQSPSSTSGTLGGGTSGATGATTGSTGSVGSTGATGSMGAAGATGTSSLSGSAGGQGQAGMSRRGRSSMSPWDVSPFGASPFQMMRQFADEMDRMFESFGFPSFGRSWAGPGRSSSSLERQGGAGGAMTSPQQGFRSFWAPQIDVRRQGNDLIVHADLPGMRKEDIHIEVRDDQLILEGERRWEQEQGGSEGEGIYRSERSYGRFFRAIPLPDGVNPEQAHAQFKDGVLEVRMPLPQEQTPQGRRIEIR
jgi:HSP20 family protein